MEAGDSEDSEILETDEEVFSPGNPDSPVYAILTDPEALHDKFEPPLTLFATQGFVSDKDDASYTSDNIYFSHVLRFYTGMQCGTAQHMTSFVSFSNTEHKSKDKMEHVLTKNCVKLNNKI